VAMTITESWRPPTEQWTAELVENSKSSSVQVSFPFQSCWVFSTEHAFSSVHQNVLGSLPFTASLSGVKSTCR
jgi:hypothetical protein